MIRMTTARMSRCWRDRTGSTAIEFALIIGPLILLTVGTFDIAIMGWKQVALQSGVSHAQRLVRTGEAASMSQDKLQDAVCAKAKTIFDICNDMIIDVRPLELGQTIPTLAELRENFESRFDPGQRGSLVIIRGAVTHRLATPVPVSLENGLLLEEATLTWVEP